MSLAVIDAELGIAAAALKELAGFLATGARPWFEAGGVPVGEEPTILHRAGQIAVDLAVARAARRRAEALGTDAAVAEARVLAGQAALDAASFLLAAGGTSASDDPRDFGRHWLAARDSMVRLSLDAALLSAGEVALSAPLDGAPAFVACSNAIEVPASLGAAVAIADAIAANLLTGAAQRDRDRPVPEVELALLSRSGLLGVTVPIRYGGPGLSFADAIEISRRLSCGDASIGQIATIHYSMVETLAHSGSDAQHARWFPRVLAGARFGNAAAERGVAHAKITPRAFL